MLLPLYCQHGHIFMMDNKIDILKTLLFYFADMCWKLIFVLVLVVYIFCEATATTCTSPGKSHSCISMKQVYHFYIPLRPCPPFTISFHCIHYTVGWDLVKVFWNPHPITQCWQSLFNKLIFVC